MNSVKFLNITKLARPAIRCLSITSPVNKQLMRLPTYDDAFFGMASNLMRNLEREFDFMNRRMGQAYQGLSDWGWGPSRSMLKLDDSFGPEDIIQIDENGNRNFKLNLSLKGFDPDDIKVNTDGQILNISAKKEKKTDDEFYLKEIYQSFSLPKELKIQDLKSKWRDGKLTIEAPLPKRLEQGKDEEKPKEKQIAIEHKSLDD